MNKLVRKNKKGFTLTEMIVVIAIIGILAAVLIPSVVIYVNKAQQNAAYQEASAVLKVYEIWQTECEAGTTEYNEFGQYYEEVVGKTVSSNMYLKGNGYSDSVTEFIFIDDGIVVVINMESNSVTYPKSFDMPESREEQTAKGYYEIANTVFR